MHHCSSSRRVFAIVNLLSIRCKSPDLRLRWQNRLAEIYVYAILEVIYVHRKWVNEYEFVVGCRRQAGQVCRRWTCRRPKKGATARLPWWCSLLRYYRDIWRVHFMTTLLQLSPTCPHTHTHKMQPHSLFAPAKYSISTPERRIFCWRHLLLSPYKCNLHAGTQRGWQLAATADKFATFFLFVIVFFFLAHILKMGIKLLWDTQGATQSIRILCQVEFHTRFHSCLSLNSLSDMQFYDDLVTHAHYWCSLKVVRNESFTACNTMLCYFSL